MIESVGEFHHIGYASFDVEKEKCLLACLGYKQAGDGFVDDVQGVSGIFMAGGGPRIELMEQTPGSITLQPWLNAGIKLYHMAYLVDDISHAIEKLRSERAKLIVPPVPAVAFVGKKIAFLMLPNKFMVEVIER